MNLTDAMRRALQNSIQAEQNAHDFYRAAAQKVNNDALRALFSQLADDEIGHRDFLQNLLDDKSAVETIKPQKVDYHLAEEVIEEKPDLTVDMPFRKPSHSRLNVNKKPWTPMKSWRATPTMKSYEPYLLIFATWNNPIRRLLKRSTWTSRTRKCGRRTNDDHNHDGWEDD